MFRNKIDDETYCDRDNKNANKTTSDFREKSIESIEGYMSCDDKLLIANNEEKLATKRQQNKLRARKQRAKLKDNIGREDTNEIVSLVAEKRTQTNLRAKKYRANLKEKRRLGQISSTLGDEQNIEINFIWRPIEQEWDDANPCK